MSIDKRKLVALKKRERFLQELEEHEEDAGTKNILGHHEELIDLFNQYARPIWIKTLIVRAIGATSFLLTTLFLISIFLDDVPKPWLGVLIPRDAYYFIMRVGTWLSMPAYILFYAPLHIIMNALGSESISPPLSYILGAIFLISWPLLSTALWMGIATALLFPHRLIRSLLNYYEHR